MQPESVIGEQQLKEMCELALHSPEGCFVEVGVYKGGSAYRLAEIAKEHGRKIFLYDTFTGIPFADSVDTHSVGDFSETSYEKVCEDIPYAQVVKGTFPYSLVEMPSVAFAHIDADQYRSVKHSIESLLPKMADGGVMLFDDYMALVGATLAVDNAFGSSVELTQSQKGFVRITAKMKEDACQSS